MALNHKKHIHIYIIFLVCLLLIPLISKGILLVECNNKLNRSDSPLIDSLYFNENRTIAKCLNLNCDAVDIMTQDKVMEKYFALKRSEKLLSISAPINSYKDLNHSREGVTINLMYKTEKSPYKFLWTAVIGGALAILGSIITLYWNDKNQVKRSKFEWGKFLFEKYEKNYLDFKKTISGTTSAMRIEENYQLLFGSSFVPRSLQISIEETIEQLKNESLTEEEKKDARNRLMEEFENFIRNPWELI